MTIYNDGIASGGPHVIHTIDGKPVTPPINQEKANNEQ